MARKMTEWPSKRGPITKIMPSDGCIGDTVPLAVGKWYDFHEFGWYMGNVGGEFVFHSARQLRERPGRTGTVQGLGTREVHERFVDGERLHQGREPQHHRPHLVAHRRVLLHVGPDDGSLGAGLERLEHRHGGAHAVGAGDVAAGGDHAPVSKTFMVELRRSAIPGISRMSW